MNEECNVEKNKVFHGVSYDSLFTIKNGCTIWKFGWRNSGALCMNEGKYKHIEIYDKGVY